jgi:3-deoxy-D-manno-octulosonate 8-phosphate phosphatase (KDO 8-P phosphatase)
MPDISLADLASPEVLARARKIKLFLMDVDGTLTDGGVCLISSTVTEGPGAVGVSEIKVFNAKDGQGLSLAQRWASKQGSLPVAVHLRWRNVLKSSLVTFVYLGQAKKMQAFEECVEKAGVSNEEVAYMGDDLPDIPLAQRAGLAISVADGAAELKAVCQYITQRPAGRGAAREVIELILKAQGRWEDAVPQALASGSLLEPQYRAERATEWMDRAHQVRCTDLNRVSEFPRESRIKIPPDPDSCPKVLKFHPTRSRRPRRRSPCGFLGRRLIGNGVGSHLCKRRSDTSDQTEASRCVE